MPGPLLDDRSPARPPPKAAGLIALAVASASVAVVTYLLLVRTGIGQRFDGLAFNGRKATNYPLRRIGAGFLGYATVPGILVLVVVLGAMSVRNGRWRVALVAGAAVIAALATTTLLKAALHHPPLNGCDQDSCRNTYPSGHATVAFALVLGSLLISTRQRRPTVRWVAIVSSLIYMTALLGSGWHRPSDVLGGCAIATAWMALAAALLGRQALQPPPARDHTGHPLASNHRSPIVQWSLGSGVIAMATAIGLLLIQNPFPNPEHRFSAYLFASVAINVFTVLVAGALLLQIDPSEQPG